MSSHKNGHPSKTVALAALPDLGQLPPLGAAVSLMDTLPGNLGVYKSVTAPLMAGGVDRACFDPQGIAKSTGALPHSYEDGACSLPPLGKLPALGLSIMDPVDVFAPAPGPALDPLAGFELPPCLVEAPQGPQPLPTHAIPHQVVSLPTTSPQEMLAELEGVILVSAQEVALEPCEEGVFAVKGSVVMNHALAGFAVDVFAHQGGAAVEFRRTSGDSAAWHTFFIAVAVAIRRARPEAAMLGGWNGAYPMEEALAPLEAFELEPMAADKVDSLLAELAAHSEFSADAVAELSTQCDEEVVGDEIAQANVASLLQHKQAVDVLITHVLTFKRDALALRGAMFVLHQCCRKSVEQQRRFVEKPLEMLVKLVALLEQPVCDLVLQHALRLVAVVAPVVDETTRWAPEGDGKPTTATWQASVAKACQVVAKYAKPQGACLSTEALHDVRCLIAAQC